MALLPAKRYIVGNLCRLGLRLMSGEATQFRVSPAAVQESPQSDQKLCPGYFHQCVTSIGVNFFAGVPDSLLSDYCAYIHVNEPSCNHVITCNEGNAVGLAAGYHLATGLPAMVYLQNSGLGNTVNPLMSLTSTQVYSIPLLLVIGWRGQPGVKDEPQHRAQGEITQDMLKIMNIPYQILPTEESAVKEVLLEASNHFEKNKSPYGILVKKSTFDSYKLPHSEPIFAMTREQSLQVVVGALGESDIIVSTTGMLSRELFEYREALRQDHEKEFLTVGSMGHASSIALGIAKQKPHRQVVCLDGDGALLMHMGAMATVGQRAPANFKHIIFNNGGHDSVGGQPTDASQHHAFSFGTIAQGCGYMKSFLAATEDELKIAVQELMASAGPAVLEIKLKLGSRSNLGRPTRTPVENKEDFMEFLQH